MNTYVKRYFNILVAILSLLLVAPLSAQNNPNRAPKSRQDSVAYSKSLQEVVVTKQAKRKEIGKEEISADQISRQMMQDAKDYIRYLPGVGISETASRFGNKGYAIRGVEENRVSISVDGMPQAETETNVVFSSYGLINSSRPHFESEFIKKIEIKKGASSFEHGTGALGGAVNFETKEASSMINDGRKFGLLGKVGMDNMTNRRIYSLGGAAQYANFEAVALFASRSGSELNNFGTGKLQRSIFSPRPDPTKYNQQSFLGKIGYTYGDHKLSISYYAQNKITDTEVWSMEPAYVLTSENEPYYYGHDQVLTKRWDFSYKYKPQVSNLINEIAVFYNTQNSYLDADTRSSIYKPQIYNFQSNYLFAGTRRMLKGMTFNDQVFAVRGISKILDFGNLGYHLLTFNASYLTHHISDKNVDISYPVNTYKEGVRYKGKFYRFGESLPQNSYIYSFQRPAERNNFSVSFSDKTSITDRLKIDLGLRFDYFRSRTLDWEQDNDFNYLNYLISNLKTAGMDFNKSEIIETGITPMAIVSYHFNPYFNLGYKFSTGYRVPTSQERFFQYVSLSPAFFVLANPKLKRETSYNNELHIGTRNTKYLGYDISLYYNAYKNYIEPLYGLQRVFFDGQNRDVAYSINENKKNATLWGWDVGTEIYLEELIPAMQKTGQYKLTTSANYSRGSFSDGTSMMSVQPLKAVVGLDYDTRKETAGISFRMNLLKAKETDHTKFVESFYGDESISRFPFNFFHNNITFDLFGYVNITQYATLRASIFNLSNRKYWLWDDLRQVISPVMLVHYKEFFRIGPNSMLRFTQPRRYFNISLEIKL